MSMLLFAAALWAGAPGEAPKVDTQALLNSPWAKAFKASNDAHFFDCMGKRILAQCKALADGAEKALTLAAKDPIAEHIILPQFFNYYRVLSERQLEAKDIKGAVASAERGLNVAFAHYDNGKHGHALSDSLGLMVAYGKALDASGRGAEAHQAFARADQIAQRFVDFYDKANPKPAKDSQAWKAGGMSMRMGADANEAWAQSLMDRKPADKTVALQNDRIAAERLARGIYFLEKADETGFIWVDSEFRWERVARMGIQRSILLSRLGQHKDASALLRAVNSMLIEVSGDGASEKAIASGWRARVIEASQNICLLAAGAKKDTGAMLDC